MTLFPKRCRPKCFEKGIYSLIEQSSLRTLHGTNSVLDFVAWLKEVHNQAQKYLRKYLRDGIEDLDITDDQTHRLQNMLDRMCTLKVKPQLLAKSTRLMSTPPQECSPSFIFYRSFSPSSSSSLSASSSFLSLRHGYPRSTP